MASYSKEYLEKQIHRAVAVHFEPPEGSRKKAQVKHGTLAAVRSSIEVEIQVHGEQYPLVIAVDADQPVYKTRDGVWWQFIGPAR